MGYVVLAVILLIIVGAVASANKQMKERKKKAEDAGAKALLQANHVEGLGLPKNESCELYCFDDKVLIESKIQKYEIQYTKLVAAEVKSEQELIEKGKSVVGRAIIGTLLVPGLGTIIGGMTGIGTKKKKGQKNYFAIFNFVNSQGELSAVTFLVDMKILADVFCKQVNESSQPFRQEVVQL